jgi:hypothetical protein
VTAVPVACCFTGHCHSQALPAILRLYSGSTGRVTILCVNDSTTRSQQCSACSSSHWHSQWQHSSCASWFVRVVVRARGEHRRAARNARANDAFKLYQFRVADSDCWCDSEPECHCKWQSQWQHYQEFVQLEDSQAQQGSLACVTGSDSLALAGSGWHW